MKVLRLIARLNVGGPARHVIWLTSGLKDRFETVLGSGRVEANEEEMSAFCDELGVKPLYIDGLGRSIGAKDLPAFLKVFAFMKRFRPDIVDTHTAKAGMLGRLSAFILNIFCHKKIRTVHTFHGHVFHGYFSPLVTKIFLGIERFLGRYATDRIIVISEQQKEELCTTYRIAPPEKFRIVPLGIDLDRIAYKKELAWGKEIRVGLVGRLTQIKDPFLFMEAVRLAAASDARIKAVLIGDGELRKELEAVSGGSAEFLGNRNDIESLMPGLDLLVISSKNEGTPMCVIEAFAAGVPVVATRAGGVVDLCADGRGLLSPLGDAGALAKNILAVVADPAAAEAMRTRAYDYVTQHYSLKRLLDDMEKLYKELEVGS